MVAEQPAWAPPLRLTAVRVTFPLEVLIQNNLLSVFCSFCEWWSKNKIKRKSLMRALYDILHFKVQINVLDRLYVLMFFSLCLNFIKLAPMRRFNFG